MDKATIGAILKNRIKEKGYTQQAFADEVGIGYSSLKKYMSGENAYSYELMELFANKLECSYDYLLGISKSPDREFHEIAEQTRLSEEAIAKLVKYAKYYDTDFEGKRYIMLLDKLIKEDRVLNTIFDYIISSRVVDEMYKALTIIGNQALLANESIRKMGVEQDYMLPLESIELISVISDLKEFKRSVTPELIEEIKSLEKYEEYLEAVGKLEAIFAKK